MSRRFLSVNSVDNDKANLKELETYQVRTSADASKSTRSLSTFCLQKPLLGILLTGRFTSTGRYRNQEERKREKQGKNRRAISVRYKRRGKERKEK